MQGIRRQLSLLMFYNGWLRIGFATNKEQMASQAERERQVALERFLSKSLKCVGK